MYIYIIQCLDGTYYTGKTKDIWKRIHNHSRGSLYTKTHKVDKLVYVEEVIQEMASKREKEVKVARSSQVEVAISC